MCSVLARNLGKFSKDCANFLRTSGYFLRSVLPEDTARKLKKHHYPQIRNILNSFLVFFSNIFESFFTSQRTHWIVWTKIRLFLRIAIIWCRHNHHHFKNSDVKLDPAKSVVFSDRSPSVWFQFKRASSEQNPKVFSALDVLRGGADKQLSVDQIQELYLSVKPGQDFPLISELPKASIDCAQFAQPGFYADTEGGQCQIFNRCDVNGNLTSYLCPNMTVSIMP